MNKLLLSVVSGLLAIWLILGSWWYAKQYGGFNDSPSFSISVEGYEISSPETFYFYESSPDPIVPKSTKEAFQSLADLLITHPNKRLKLYGTHSVQESQAKLGKARAESIKLELVNLGAPEDQIATTDIPLASSNFVNGQLYGGVHFRFEDFNKKPIQPVHDNLPVSAQIPPTNIYFDPNEVDLIMTKKLEDYVEVVKKLLRKSPDTDLAIIGYTDSRGNSKVNLDLAQKRAKNVKKFLIRHGFDPQQLKLEYKSAITSDDPAQIEDSKKNRRVELRIRE